MKVLTVQPVAFITADSMVPEDLNSCWLYAKDALIDASQKRWAKAPLLLPFVEAVDTPYTQAMTAEELSYRFQAPVTCVLERGFLHADMISSADVQVNVTKVSDGATPVGCTVPWLATGAGVASATTDTLDINVDRVVLDANTEYKFALSSAGTFTLNRADCILHLATDRWTPAGVPAVPDFQPTLFTDATGADPVLVNANNASLTTEVAKLASSKGKGMTPVMFVKHGLLSGTSANLVKFTLPRFTAARAAGTCVRIYLFVQMATTVGGTVTATLKDETGATKATVTANVAGVLQASVDSGALAIALDGGDPSDFTKDYSLTFANSSAAVNAIKVSALVWIARA